jgi:hypothetical protein
LRSLEERVLGSWLLDHLPLGGVEFQLAACVEVEPRLRAFPLVVAFLQLYLALGVDVGVQDACPLHAIDIHEQNDFPTTQLDHVLL